MPLCFPQLSEINALSQMLHVPIVQSLAKLFPVQRMCEAVAVSF